MSSKIKVYADAVVKYETNLKEIEKKIAEDGKKLILLSESLTQKLKSVAEEYVTSISAELERKYAEEANKLRLKYGEERSKEINKIKQLAEDNLDKAVDFVISKLLEAYK